MNDATTLEVKANLDAVSTNKRLGWALSESLSEITYAAGQLKRHLNSVKDDAEQALGRMESGSMPFGSTNFGPIGHQAPFDLAVKVTELRIQMKYAHIAGATEGDIQLAYLRGYYGHNFEPSMVVDAEPELIMALEAAIKAESAR